VASATVSPSSTSGATPMVVVKEPSRDVRKHEKRKDES
jgi:hypothetical protein